MTSEDDFDPSDFEGEAEEGKRLGEEGMDRIDRANDDPTAQKYKQAVFYEFSRMLRAGIDAKPEYVFRKLGPCPPKEGGAERHPNWYGNVSKQALAEHKGALRVVEWTRPLGKKSHGRKTAVYRLKDSV